MRRFIYDPTMYLFDVIITGIVSIGAAVVAAWLMLNTIFPALMFLLLVSGVYSAYNLFIAKVHPKVILIEGKVISFESFGVKKTYCMDQVETFKIREFPSAGKIYLRIASKNNKSSKCWINTKCYNDSQVLFKQLLELEYEKHPDTLKARARRVNTEYLQGKGVKQH